LRFVFIYIGQGANTFDLKCGNRLIEEAKVAVLRAKSIYGCFFFSFFFSIKLSNLTVKTIDFGNNILPDNGMFPVVE
jgi:hypothetical protein